VPLSAIKTIAEVVEDPHIAARNMIVNVPSPETDRHVRPADQTVRLLADYLRQGARTGRAQCTGLFPPCRHHAAELDDHAGQGSDLMAVDLAIDGHVAVISLNRPDKLNALTLAMYDALGAAFHQGQCR
jgi:hypothetical protein